VIDWRGGCCLVPVWNLQDYFRKSCKYEYGIVMQNILFASSFWFTNNEVQKMGGGVAHYNIAQINLEKLHKNPKNIRSPCGRWHSQYQKVSFLHASKYTCRLVWKTGNPLISSFPCHFPFKKSKIDSQFSKFVSSTVAYVNLSVRN